MQASSVLRRVTGHVLTVASFVVAAHVVVLCVSGGVWPPADNPAAMENARPSRLTGTSRSEGSA